MKINKSSPDFIVESQSWLKEKFPFCFSEGKLDFDKLKVLLSEISDTSDEKYSFSWAGRSESIKNLQTSSRGTLIPDKDESVNFDETENVFIEGENLEVLKLLQKSYTGKIKMIYIDPPYNTGNDFIYKDDFKSNLDSYLEQTGQSKDGIKMTSNPEASGRFHSDWISFMYTRLFIAREFLSDDGVIFVSIDDNEFPNLRNMMNGIFGEENFIINIIWKKRSGPPNDQTIGTVHEYILCYAKNQTLVKLFRKSRSEKQLNRYQNHDNHPNGPWASDNLMANVKGGRYVKSLYFPIINPNTGEKFLPSSNGNWRFNQEKIQKLLENDEIYFGKDGKGRPKLKRFLSSIKDGVPFGSIWSDVGYNNTATLEIEKFFGSVNVFDTPKPTTLIKEILNLSTDKEDDFIILDFFAGSGTTAHSILDLNFEDNRNLKFILVQIPEIIIEKNSGLELNTISDITKYRIRKSIEILQTKNSKQDLGFKVFKLTKSNYKIWEDVKDEKKLKDQLKLFEDPLVENYKDIDVLYEIIIKEGYSLNSKIEEFQNKPNKIFKVIDDEFFFYVTLDKKINEKVLSELKLDKNTMFVCLDSAINDSQKTNLDKLCKLKVI